MLVSSLVMLHVCSATVALLSGVLAMLFRKGSSLHRLTGNFFFVSMVAMAGSGAALAAFVRPNAGNVMGGLLTLYLVCTGWAAGRRNVRAAGPFDVVALLGATGVAAAGARWGMQAAAAPGGALHDYPAAFYFVFGGVALLFAGADVRMIRRGAVSGPARVSRHVLRISLAFLMALLSFYPGQARLFPSSWRETPLPMLPHLFVAGAMAYWLVRLARQQRASDRRRVAHRAIPDTGDSLASRVASPINQQTFGR